MRDPLARRQEFPGELGERYLFLMEIKRWRFFVIFSPKLNFKELYDVLNNKQQILVLPFQELRPLPASGVVEDGRNPSVGVRSLLTTHVLPLSANQSQLMMEIPLQCIHCQGPTGKKSLKLLLVSVTSS